jgi:hypothetical protein
MDLLLDKIIIRKIPNYRLFIEKLDIPTNLTEEYNKALLDLKRTYDKEGL